MDINLDDSDEEKKAPSRRGPSRVLRHAPRSSKPKTEQVPQSSAPLPEPKSENQGRTPAAVKHETHIRKEDMELEVSKPSIIITPKIEEAAFERLKIDSEVKQMEIEIENDSTQAVPMDEEKLEEEVEEEEEDMIVREIDVYLNPSIDPKTQLYLLQYPLRACWRPYELEERCEEVRVKTSTAEMEVDLSLDLQSNCDTDFANRLNMTKQTLASTWNPPQASGYAVGILKRNELYLHPIQAVVQLRPSMDHLKATESKRRSNTTDVEIKLEDATDKKSAGSSKKQPKTKESTDTKIEGNEGWVSLKYHGQTSEFSENYLQKMVAKEESPLQFTIKPHDYINLLCPGASSSGKKSKDESRKSLLSLPLEERIKKLLSEKPLFHRFSVLKHFAPDSSIEGVLEIVQQQALLVQGLWTPKVYPSSLTDPKEANFVRDYILLHFCQNTVFSLDKSDLTPRQRKLAKDLLLPVIAVERPLFKDWKFKADPDASFQKQIKKYPDIIKKKNDVWNKIASNVNNKLSSKNNSIPKLENTSASATESDKGAKQSGGSASGGPRTGKKMSDETLEALPIALKKVFQTYKVCSLQLINQSLRNLSVSEASRPKPDHKILIAAAHGVDASPQEFEEVLNQIAFNINGVYVLKSSTENPEYDPLRKVVIDLLRGKPANGQLKKTEVLEAAKIELKRDIPNNEYIKVIGEICESKGSSWVLKSGDGSTKKL